MIAIKKDAMRYRDPETGEFVGVSLIGGDAPSGGTPVEIDATLTQSGKAADAKVVGDQLSALNEANAAQDERLNTLEQASGIVTVEPAQDDVPIVFFGGDLPQTIPIQYFLQKWNSLSLHRRCFRVEADIMKSWRNGCHMVHSG